MSKTFIVVLIGVGIVVFFATVNSDTQRMSTAPVSSKVSGDIEIVREEYVITGATLDELRLQIKQRGPQPEGEHIIGYARVTWKFQQTHRLLERKNTCEYADVKMIGKIHVIMPKWDKPSDVTGDVISAWNAFYVALDVHEQGHIDIGLQAAQAIQEALANYPAQPTCDQFVAQSQARGQQIYKQFDEKSIQYDQQTKNGQTQGVVL